MKHCIDTLNRKELPGWLGHLLSSAPAAGSGLHQWIFKAAHKLKYWRHPHEIFRLLTAATQGCGRDVSREIREAIANSQGERPLPHSGWNTLTAAPPPPKWPARSLAGIEKIALKSGGLADLTKASPVDLAVIQPDAEDLIDTLFPRECLLCVANSPEDAFTAPREYWRGSLSGRSLIVPSPMLSLKGRRKDGGPSNRCLDNTGPRRYLVVEFDFQSARKDGAPTPEASLLSRLESRNLKVQDLCAALLLALARVAPLALVTHSGGKSLHGWFVAKDTPDPTLKHFFRHAVTLGADPATWTRCQLIRIPEGRRADGARQRLLFLNPSLIPET